MHSTVTQYLRIVEEYLAADRTRLEELRQRISGQGVEVSHMVIDGLPDRGICLAADELDVDLIITGTHGRTGLRRFFLGSVAEHVVRFSQRNVMVCRKGAGSAGGGPGRILVATDFSDAADRAAAMAVLLAREGAKIDFLHCWYLPPMSYPYYAPTKSAAELVGSIRDSITASNDELGRELIERHARPGVELAFHQVEAAPAQGIQEWLEKKHDEGEYDLVLTGSHGRRGPARFLLGSVAELTVRHAPCSVLVVHSSKPQDSKEAMS